MTIARFLVAVCLLVACSTHSAAQTSPSIGFKLYRSEPMRPADRAGAVPASNWNNVRDLSTGAAIRLSSGTVVDGNGSVVPGVTAVFGGGTTVGGANTIDLSTGTANDARLFNAAYVQGTGTGVWFPGTGSPSTVTIDNIPYANYDVYVYLADRGAGSAAKVDYGNIGYVASGWLGATSGYVVSSAVLMNSPAITKGNTIRIPNLHGPLSLSLAAVSNGAAAPSMGFVGLQIVSTAAPAFTQPLTQLYQYAVPLVPNQADYTSTVKQDPDSWAYLWVPPDVKRVRGLLVAAQNMLEREVLADPTIRAALAQAGMGVVWMTPGGMNLGNTSSSGPKPVNNNPVQQEAIELVRALNALAVRSGYAEIADAPIMLVGHSAATPFVWTDGLHTAPALAGRVFGLLPYKGWYPQQCPRDIPMLSVASQWAEITPPGEVWGMSANFVKDLLKQGSNCLLGVYLDVGAGHLTWSPGAAASPIAQFIVSTAAARIPAVLPASGPVTLNPARYSSGYVVPFDQLGAANAAPVAAANYGGGGGTAYWFPDQATANAVQNRMATELAKKPQMIDMPLNGNSQLSVDRMEPVFWSGPSYARDGTFKVAGQFIDKSPFPSLFPGLALGQSANGPIQYRVNGSGGLRQTGPDTFKVWIDRGNAASQGNPAGARLLATHPGDSSYRATDRPVNTNITTVYKTGNAQTINVAPVPDQQASSLAPVALKASATSGMPVQFWVVAGPYTITDDGVLQPQPIPTRSVYPVQVTVGAYQIGGRDAQGGAWQSVGPVFTTFQIHKPGLGNLALGKPARQSTTAFGGDPARAVDGNTSGLWSAGSVTHTDGWDFNPWWQVDLGKTAAIDTLRLWNRTDCCADRLGNATVFVSDSDMSGRTNAQLQADASVQRWPLKSLFGVDNATLQITGQGRYVRIQLDGQANLSLAEVQVFGAYGAPVNLALGKPATQSSTVLGAGAQRAVDGNTNGAMASNSVTHTDNAAWSPWWQVDLGSSVAVDRVVLWNRTDCCSSRLANLQVFVSGTDMTGRTYAQLLADTTVKKVGVASLDGAPSVSLSLGGSAGRFVRVQLAGQDYLSLAEVQVFGR